MDAVHEEIGFAGRCGVDETLCWNGVTSMITKYTTTC